MKRIVSSSLLVFAMLFGTAGLAAAQPSTQPSQAAPAGASAEVAAGTGFANKAATDPASEFAAGTKVFVVSKVIGAPNTVVTHVWKLNGAKNWQQKLKVGSKAWTTSSRRKVKAGAWTVEVQAADGTVLGSVDFTVK